jgi:hypothetical protein
MVVCIHDFPQKVHEPISRVTKVAAPPRQVSKEPDDNDPNDDPHTAIQLAA